MIHLNISKMLLTRQRCAGNIMIVQVIARISFAIFVLLFANFLESEAGVLRNDADLYKQVMPHAIALKEAVLARQINVLINYSSPDPLYSYAEFLSDKTSEEYKYLYDDKWNINAMPSRKSIYSVLKSAKKLTIILESTNGVVTVYYYDATKIRLTVPLSKNMAAMWGRQFVTCRLVHTEKGWKVAYSIFDYGTDYISNR